MIRIATRRAAHPVHCRGSPRPRCPGGTAVGFGHSLPAEDGAAAQFKYENGNGERLTLYLRAGVGGETAFRYHEEGGVGAFYWSDEGFGYAIAAKANPDLLPRIAELVYRQTSPDGAGAKIPPAPGRPADHAELARGIKRDFVTP